MECHGTQTLGEAQRPKRAPGLATVTEGSTIRRNLRAVIADEGMGEASPCPYGGSAMSQARSVVRFIVHVVWSTHDRVPTLAQPACDAWLAETLSALARARRAEVLAVGNADDHVHVVVRLPSTLALATLVHALKGASSHAWNHRPSASTPLSWQDGYWAESCDPDDLGELFDYVRSQRNHHATPHAPEPWENPDAP
jgi:REP-associated tyrosine transposase